MNLSRTWACQLGDLNIGGRSVRTLVDKEFPAGVGYTSSWNGKEELGQDVASGVYLYQLKAGGLVKTRKR